MSIRDAFLAGCLCTLAVGALLKLGYKTVMREAEEIRQRIDEESIQALAKLADKRKREAKQIWQRTDEASRQALAKRADKPKQRIDEESTQAPTKLVDEPKPACCKRAERNVELAAAEKIMRLETQVRELQNGATNSAGPICNRHREDVEQLKSSDSSLNKPSLDFEGKARELEIAKYRQRCQYMEEEKQQLERYNESLVLQLNETRKQDPSTRDSVIVIKRLRADYQELEQANKMLKIKSVQATAQEQKEHSLAAECKVANIRLQRQNRYLRDQLRQANMTRSEMAAERHSLEDEVERLQSNLEAQQDEMHLGDEGVLIAEKDFQESDTEQ